MKVAVRTEPDAGEQRVAATPDSVRHLIGLGLDVVVQSGAGALAGYPDPEYQLAGARIDERIDLATVEVLAHVRPLSAADAEGLQEGAVTVGLASPASQLAVV